MLQVEDILDLRAYYLLFILNINSWMYVSILTYFRLFQKLILDHSLKKSLVNKLLLDLNGVGN